MEKLDLDAIPEEVRLKIANALRSAAEKWITFSANEAAGFSIADTFLQQAREAIAIAEQMEDIE